MSPGQKVVIHIDERDKLPNIPDCESIIKQSFELMNSETTDSNISGVRIRLSSGSSDRDVSDIWVKFGLDIRMNEARTQQLVAQYLEEHETAAVRAPRVYLAFTSGRIGFIVSEYIDGRRCRYSKADIARVAAAVQALLKIPSPSAVPGPVGGGIIEHPFFIEQTSDIWYESVEELEGHVNGILAATDRTQWHVDLKSEVAHTGLILCASDIHHSNFMTDRRRGGQLVAVAFGGYAFLPPSFFALALELSSKFAYNVGLLLEYPKAPSTGANSVALCNASWGMVPFGTNALGLKRQLRSRRAR